MSTLADRIKDAIDTVAFAEVDYEGEGFHQAERVRKIALANVVLANSETILTALSASERLAKEHAELRAALFYTRDTLFVLPKVFMDDLELRIRKATAMADAVLQPTPEPTKEQ